MKKAAFYTLFLLFLIVSSPPAEAAELSGTILNQGIPAVNLTVTIKEKNIQTKTDHKGTYKFDLPPGTYTLIVRGIEFPVSVSEKGGKKDIPL
ncbi:MAG: carboxypeptidase regulatory-like domain-containing protein [Candidatus Manganitrophaceae bacterium]